MIDRMLFVSPSLTSYERKEGNQPLLDSGGSKFLNLLLQTITKAGAGSKPSPSTSQFPLSTLVSMEMSLPQGKTDPVDKGATIRFVLAQEGSKFVARDGGNESSKFGILQATAERFGHTGSVKNMTRQEAENVYDKIWAESGAEKLRPDLALVHFDTYVNSPAAARKILKASNGNTEAYLTLRSERYARISALQPGRYGKYMKGWMNRIENLRSLVAENSYSSSSRGSS
jgi:lysozyme family protein